MNPLFVLISLGPMALYLLVLAFINSRSCPTVVSGKRDLMLLGLGMLGFVFIGPIQMLVPINAIVVWGFAVWGLMILLYIMILFLLGTYLRPRIVIYNISYDEARSLLSKLALKLDFEARWAGASLNLPGLGIHLYLENCMFLNNISLVAAGAQLDPRGWNRLEEALFQETKTMRSEKSSSWKYFAVTGAVACFVMILTLITSRDVILETVQFYLFSCFRGLF